MSALKKQFLLALATTCSLFSAVAQDTVTTASAAGNQRIVSLNGSNTELLFALGAGDQVVGRDDSATYPAEVEKIPSVGYQYQLNAEGILSLKPTLVVGRTDVKPPTVIDQVKAAGVNVALIEEPDNIEEAADRILQLGKLTGTESKAKELATQLEKDAAAFEARKAELAGDKKKAVFIYMRGPSTTFVLGNETNPGRMLELAGAENVMADVGRSAPVTAEALIAAQPEVIVVFKHGLESVGGIDGLMKLQGVAQTPAGKNKRIVVMDDLYLGGFTNRAGKAALDLVNALHGNGVVVVE